MAPIGLIILRLLLFWQDGAAMAEQIIGDIVRVRSNRSLPCTGVGTAMVLGRLAILSARPPSNCMTGPGTQPGQPVNGRTEGYSERRFRDLITASDFHAINADLQEERRPPGGVEPQR